jgi:hypothetical protein
MERKMIKQIGIVAGLIVVGLNIAACSTLRTTVIPESPNRFTVVATADNESTAFNGAIRKAQCVCNRQNMQVVILRHRTFYQVAGAGIGRRRGLITGTAAVVTGPFGRNRGAEDYKSIVSFSCVAPEVPAVP